MDNGTYVGNPYDFRSPVRHGALLAGRSYELGEIDRFLCEAASGRPVHFSLFGAQGSGKSSLLNGVASLARDRGLLAVKLPLREAILDNELEFYKALCDAALEALVEAGQLGGDDPVIRAWLLQTCDLPSDGEKGPFEIGLLAAAKAKGQMVSVVPTPLVKRDLQRLLSMGSGTLRGLVLCLDNAELLDRNHDLGPSLLLLAESSPLLTIVTAAESAGDLQKVAPRAWGQVEVRPFRDPGDVLDAITKPVNDVDSAIGAPPPSPATAMDILELTGGVPYEVNLVCHFIWDAIQQGEQESFELSTAVIERVTAELEEKGRHQASGEIATFSALPASDYDLLVKVAPYEALTTRQIALMRLMLDDYDEADLEAAEDIVRCELRELEGKGVVQIESDRFEVVGGRDARLYLRYAAQRHTGHMLHYGDSYARTATVKCAAHTESALVGDYRDKATLLGRGRPHELGGSSVGKWLESVGTAAVEHDLPTLSQLLGLLHSEAVLRREEDTFILIGLQLQIGIHDVEHVALIANVEALSPDETRERMRRWVADHEVLLDKYDVRVVNWNSEQMSPSVLRAALAYGQLHIFCGLSYPIYRAGAVELAEGLLGEALDEAEKLVGPDPSDPLLRTQFASALHRYGFMAATRGDWETALRRLELSQTMALADEWLLDYNTAYVRARQGDLADAVKLASSALEHYDERTGRRMVLHAFFPTPDGWAAPHDSWNAVELQGNWIRRFVELQLLVFRAAEMTQNRQELESALVELSGSAPPPLLRLAGWAQLTILERPREAANLFARAVAGTRYDEADVPRLESNYAEGIALLASAQRPDAGLQAIDEVPEGEVA